MLNIGPTSDQLFSAAQRHHQDGLLHDAEALYRRILEVNPDHPEALHYLGVLSGQLGHHTHAIDLIRRAIALAPDNVACRNNLGNVLREAGRWKEAVGCLRECLLRDPGCAEAINNLGMALHGAGQLEESVAALRRASELLPNSAEVWTNLGSALEDLGRMDEAMGCCGHAVELAPRSVPALLNLAGLLRRLGQFDASANVLAHCLRLEPDDPRALANLGLLASDCGRVDQAIASLRKAVALKPSPTAHSNLVMMLNGDPHVGPADLLREARHWNTLHAASLTAHATPHATPHANAPSPDRRLRVGYVSGDFRRHASASFLLPLLRAHDPAQVEVYCYSGVLRPDDTTRQFQALAAQWRPLAGMSDQELSQTIRRDAIDILVDLHLHSERNRLLAFARKPAPIQVSWLGYPGTTGLQAMDYRLTDRFIDPPGTDLSLYSEESIRLPGSFWCYSPLLDLPPASEPPAASRGKVTFGCFATFSRFAPACLSLWQTLLREIPSSRLLLHVPAGAHREELLRHMSAAGVAPERIAFFTTKPLPEYFQLYHQIDIHLDSFPWAGGTTSCDALYMGVPVITLAGKTAPGRGGVSILSTLGMPELIAQTPEEYLRLARSLAADLPRLRALRQALRPAMQASPLMDAPAFARGIEDAYRQMWRNWCSTHAAAQLRQGGL